MVILGVRPRTSIGRYLESGSHRGLPKEVSMRLAGPFCRVVAEAGIIVVLASTVGSIVGGGTDPGPGPGPGGGHGPGDGPGNVLGTIARRGGAGGHGAASR